MAIQEQSTGIAQLARSSGGSRGRSAISSISSRGPGRHSVGGLARCRIGRVDHSGGDASKNLAALTNDDRIEFQGIAHPGARGRSLVTRGALRLALSEYVGGALAPADWSFTRDDNGRPILAGETARRFRYLDFSCSHTPWMSVVAISDSGRIGVDIEACQCGYDDGLAMHFLSARERCQVRALPEEARSAVFARLWSLKEAYVKALGSGISEDLAALSFDAISDQCFFVEPTFELPNGVEFASWKTASAGGQLFAAVAAVET